MNGLPLHLMYEILFRTDLKSLTRMRCTYKSLHSNLSHDPYFESEYFSRVGSGLLYISTYGSNMLCYHYLGDSKSPRTKAASTECRILGSCSGLLLLFFDGLCVANPLTKKFRFLDHFRSKFFPCVSVPLDRTMYIGFAVNQIDRTTQSYKIVCINEVKTSNKTMYSFEINAGNSWRLSETSITCDASDLDVNRMKNPVYVNRSLHWLRNDGSILAFNSETEQAQLIPVEFPEELSVKTLFAASDNSLALISATEEVIYVYALESILDDPKWVLVRWIRNGVLDVKKLIMWNVEAYDGKCLVLREEMWKTCYDRAVHAYDLRANKWQVMGSIPVWCDANQDFFQYTPSTASVLGFDEKEKKKMVMILECDDDKRISSLSSIMSLIDGI